MAEDRVYHGVYLQDAGDQPVALFRDGDQAQRWRKGEYGDVGMVAIVDLDVPKNADVAGLLTSAPASDAAPAEDVNVGDEVRKAEIRARLEREERDRRLEDEVRAEMAAEQDGDDEETVELREPRTSAAGSWSLDLRDAGTPPPAETGTAIAPVTLSLIHI